MTTMTTPTTPDDNDQLKSLYAHYVSQRKGYNFTWMTYDEWVLSGDAARALTHFKTTGYMPGQYIGPVKGEHP